MCAGLRLGIEGLDGFGLVCVCCVCCGGILSYT